jgi:NAD(P)-dependent dehydrogenase (short-subunit alcohol dehydrogenase family)
MGLQSKRIHGIARDTVTLLLRDGDIRIAPGRSGELLRRELSAILHEFLAQTGAAREELQHGKTRDPAEWSARWRAFLTRWKGDAEALEAIDKMVDWITNTPTVDRVLVSRSVLRKRVASVVNDDPTVEVQAEGKALDLRQRLRRSMELLITPQLQQAMKILQLSRTELIEQVKKELEEHPVLELPDETAEGHQSKKAPGERPFEADDEDKRKR